ncbi:MAG: 30S ribosomal protein S16 [bacterium]|nr:30S ribosomal protein S16 [bacterium]
MLTIRLQRVGTKNSPAFRVVLAEAHRSVSKKFLEILGHYNPGSKVFGIKDEERLKYWLSQNVQLSPTVHNLLVEKKLIDDKKLKAWRPKIKEAPKEDAPKAARVEAQTQPTAETKPVEPKIETSQVSDESKKEVSKVEKVEAEKVPEVQAKDEVKP